MEKFIVPAGSLCHIAPANPSDHTILTQTTKRCIFDKDDVIRGVNGELIMSWDYDLIPPCPTWLKESVTNAGTPAEKTYSMWFLLENTTYNREGQYKGSSITSMQIPIKYITGIDADGDHYKLSQMIEPII